jgi:hypothetical protein
MLTVISISTKIKLSIEDFNAMYNKIAENEKGSIFFGVGFNKDYKNNIYHVVVNKELSKSDIEDIKKCSQEDCKVKVCYVPEIYTGDLFNLFEYLSR